jgi:hypothetical protein
MRAGKAGIKSCQDGESVFGIGFSRENPSIGDEMFFEL